MSPVDLPGIRSTGAPEETLDRLVEGFDRAKMRATARVERRSIAGVAFEISIAGEPMAQRILPALSGVASAGPADFSILVWDSATTGIPLPHLPWGPVDIGPRGEVAKATNDDIRTVFLAAAGALSVLDVRRRVGVFCVPDASRLPWYERAAPLRTLIHWALAAKGRSLVHAAAVASNGAGALLAGRGGSGKSTTAMLCLEAGFGYAGDDYVAIVNDGAVEAHAVYQSVKLAPSSIPFVPFLARALHLDSEPGAKGVAIVGDVAPERLAQSFPVRALVIPRVSGGASRLSRASGAEALRALAPTTLLQLSGADGATFSGLADVCRGLAAWHLDLGDDRDAIPRLVARAISESQ